MEAHAEVYKALKQMAGGDKAQIGFVHQYLKLEPKRWYGKIVKWVAESYIDPLLTKVFKKTIVSRNEVMHDSVEYLAHIIPDETDILQEYYIPHDKLIECITEMGKILKNVSVLNASIRLVHQESNLLNYAPTDMFAVVLYLNQKVTPKALSTNKALTQELINLILNCKGTFFLPYQLDYTKNQLKKAYPTINEFFAQKRSYDPELLFMNAFYEKYS